VILAIVEEYLWVWSSLVCCCIS